MRHVSILAVLAVYVASVAAWLYGCKLAGIDAADTTKTSQTTKGNNSPAATATQSAKTTQLNTAASTGARVNNVTIAAGGGWLLSLAAVALLWRNRSVWKREADGWTKATTRLVAALEHGKRSQLTAENVCNYIKSHPKDDSEKRIHQRVKAVENHGK